MAKQRDVVDRAEDLVETAIDEAKEEVKEQLEDVKHARPPWGRILLMLITGVSLYIFAPSLAEVFEAWDRLGEVHPFAVLAVVACEGLSFFCVWGLQRISLNTTQWYSVATTQLAGNAFNRITPGGGATGTALQARMLADAGFATTKAATALAVQSVFITAAVAAMPILSLPAIILLSIDVPGKLADGAWLGAGLFAVMLLLGGLLLGSRTFACKLGGTIEGIANKLPRKTPMHGLGERILRERDEIRKTMGEKWPQALAFAVGRWAFEYFALLITLYAIGAKPEPWLVLLAFVFASALGMIPFTPGGLGFVEAGLTGSLALAGISAQEAVLATLVFRLVSFWLPLPIGAIAGVAYRRRYPHKKKSTSGTRKKRTRTNKRTRTKTTRRSTANKSATNKSATNKSATNKSATNRSATKKSTAKKKSTTNKSATRKSTASRS